MSEHDASVELKNLLSDETLQKEWESLGDRNPETKKLEGALEEVARFYFHSGYLAGFSNGVRAVPGLEALMDAPAQLALVDLPR